MKTSPMLVLAAGVLSRAQVSTQESPPRIVVRQENAQAGRGVGGSSIQLGTPIHTVDAIVPDKLRDKRVATVVSATIKSDGSNDLSAVGGDSDFRQPALDAVRQ